MLRIKLTRWIRFVTHLALSTSNFFLQKLLGSKGYPLKSYLLKITSCSNNDTRIVPSYAQNTKKIFSFLQALVSFTRPPINIRSNEYTNAHGFMVQRPIKISQTTWLISGANPSDDTRSFVPFSRSRFSFFPSPYHAYTRSKAFLFSFPPLVRRLPLDRFSSPASTQKGIVVAETGKSHSTPPTFQYFHDNLHAGG